MEATSYFILAILCAVVGMAFAAYAMEGPGLLRKRTVKAILRCTDCCGDLCVVTNCLTNEGLVIKRTKMGSSIYPELTIQADSMYHLSSAVEEANAVSTYGVTVLKIKAK